MTTTPDPWRSPFIDNATLLGQQDSGVVAPTAGGEFFAVWRDDNPPMKVDPDIIARKFDSLGNPLTGNVDITQELTLPKSEPAAVRLPIPGQADGLAVAFTREVNNTDVWAVRTDAALTTLDAPFGTGPLIPISTSQNFIEDHPSITSFSDGSFWVAFTVHFSDTDWDILARRVNADGTFNNPGGPTLITLFDDIDRSD